ncbi:MAG: lycopene cyclase domain-containing protein [Patescibacteria group bacterium]
MIPNRYAYMTGCLIFFIPWTILFWKRKDLRREMLVMGLIAGIVSYASAYFWTMDWWRPQTITGTRLGIEDFILGISNGGIAAVLYEEIFRKKLYRKRTKNDKRYFYFLVCITFLLFYVFYRVFKTTTFYACIFSLLIYCGFMLITRKDLIFSSLVNGLLMVLIAAPVYSLLILLSPGFVNSTYIYKETLTGIRVFSVPVEEFVFYFVFGFMVALMYEYWHGLGLRNFARAKNS